MNNILNAVIRIRAYEGKIIYSLEITRAHPQQDMILVLKREYDDWNLVLADLETEGIHGIVEWISPDMGV